MSRGATGFSGRADAPYSEATVFNGFFLSSVPGPWPSAASLPFLSLLWNNSH